MADVTEVAQALVVAIASAAYPNGTNSPSIGNCPILVFQGWPNQQKLTADLAAGKVNISVFPRPNVKQTWIGEGTWQNGTTNADSSVNIWREVRRQRRDFQITVWANCFELRDPVAKAVDAALAIIPSLRIVDGTAALLRYSGDVQDDDGQKQGVYRRDILYSCEYSTVENSVAYPIKTIKVNAIVTRETTPQPQATPIADIEFNVITQP